jgi:DNA-directed RNA polymerase specialized sigma24 family protein
MDLGKKSDFEHFVVEVEPSLRRALVASYGFDLGREATANALGWAWEHRERLERVGNKVAYLYRVGQSSVRRRKAPVEFMPCHSDEPWFEPSLGPSLAALTDRQRTAVVLVHGFAWTLGEVAELTGTRISTVQSHLERGLRNLRIAMEVTDNA